MDLDCAARPGALVESEPCHGTWADTYRSRIHTAGWQVWRWFDQRRVVGKMKPAPSGSIISAWYRLVDL